MQYLAVTNSGNTYNLGTLVTRKDSMNVDNALFFHNAQEGTSCAITKDLRSSTFSLKMAKIPLDQVKAGSVQNLKVIHSNPELLDLRKCNDQLQSVISHIALSPIVKQFADNIEQNLIKSMKRKFEQQNTDVSIAISGAIETVLSTFLNKLREESNSSI